MRLQAFGNQYDTNYHQGLDHPIVVKKKHDGFAIKDFFLFGRQIRDDVHIFRNSKSRSRILETVTTNLIGANNSRRQIITILLLQ